MRSGAAAGHTGYFHEALCYDSEDQLLDVVVPFLLDGIDAGEPTIVALGEQHAAAVRAALPKPDAVNYLGGEDLYARPAVAIKSYRALLAEHVAAGAGQIRIVGELAATAFGLDWDWWARYEAAINHAYDEFPLWSMCAYDRRVTPPHVLDDVDRTHPWVSTNGNHPTNPRYLAPPAFLSPSRLIAPHPVEDTPPVAEFTEPTLPAVRHAVQQANQGRLGEDELADFVVAVNEVVTNALQHGTPPLRARLWATDRGLVLSVTDQGAGPTDPFAGLLPAAHAPVGGLGMWMAYQLCDHVAVGRDPNGGFTIRLTARAAR